MHSLEHASKIPLKNYTYRNEPQINTPKRPQSRTHHRTGPSTDLYTLRSSLLNLQHGQPPLDDLHLPTRPLLQQSPVIPPL